jgi:hypothetical protein
MRYELDGRDLIPDKGKIFSSPLLRLAERNDSCKVAPTGMRITFNCVQPRGYIVMGTGMGVKKTIIKTFNF